ncbi:hypothetical protein V5N11_026871 [Cardamine amara subsp. amara]|uniref:Uncharacterized protein n=1 Tax=Cardamine amara subsp. amara TaxID=228776 RepID=A0ABD0ZUX2_CARAN
MGCSNLFVKVEKDAERAQEYYGRAILENRGDGDVLTMYGKLIWETKRYEKRGQGYFDQDVNASPDIWLIGEIATMVYASRPSVSCND